MCILKINSGRRAGQRLMNGKKKSPNPGKNFVTYIAMVYIWNKLADRLIASFVYIVFTKLLLF
jgi:hypothetical protein